MTELPLHLVLGVGPVIPVATMSGDTLAVTTAWPPASSSSAPPWQPQPSLPGTGWVIDSADDGAKLSAAERTR